MYQFYYADRRKKNSRTEYRRNIKNEYMVTAIRPTMWEEHCLECSAPTCYKDCVHYAERKDGRCKRFDNGMQTFADKRACCGQGTHIQFRKWANMMTIIFPAMLSPKAYYQLCKKNQKLGNILKKIANSKLPTKVKWESIRTIEFLRRRNLRKLDGLDNQPDAFLFHGYSHEKEAYQLIIEIYDDHTPVFKTSLKVVPGENLHVIERQNLSPECWKTGNLLKVYPENNIEALIDILWCDFVKGKKVIKEGSANTVKCVVWDLDNTLWDGTLIETDDPNTLQLKDHVLDVMKDLDAKGIIQSIASKNDYESAWKVVENLGIADYFLYPQIHWNAKSNSMLQIATSLNIGIDTFAFIDDSIFEREQVKSVYPQIRVYDETEIETLLARPEFDVVVTEESKNRRLMYKAEEKRNQLLNSGNNDTIEFLNQCNLQLQLFEPKTEEEKLRCYELVIRTNQLNMSGNKYSKEEFAKVLNRENHNNFAFSCKDDFGEYGIVGYGQYYVKDSELIFTEFAMSCRVAGKYVESALFHELLYKEKCDSGKFFIKKTKKNVLLRNTLEEIGFVIQKQSDKLVQYSFDSRLNNASIVKVFGEMK
ncbi:HAD-IIIC family phosphatase [Anaerostipes faecalis]|uniref:HAD-IIIC family phosphatase n=1 Tax=Anaerostipes faecalis TaxID=2738446 RepID=UPI001C1E378B|nr:HAD-IIIC family phosphatase [Anaerostipes faecalis]